MTRVLISDDVRREMELIGPNRITPAVLWDSPLISDNFGTVRLVRKSDMAIVKTV